MSLFAWIFNGRVTPVPARREAVVSEAMPPANHGADAPGDCFPHVFGFAASGGELVASRRYLVGEVPSEFTISRLADQPPCDGPASSDFVSPFHSPASARTGEGGSAGKRARLTRLRVALGRALARGRA